MTCGCFLTSMRNCRRASRTCLRSPSGLGRTTFRPSFFFSFHGLRSLTPPYVTSTPSPHDPNNSRHVPRSHSAIFPLRPFCRDRGSLVLILTLSCQQTKYAAGMAAPVTHSQFRPTPRFHQIFLDKNAHSCPGSSPSFTCHRAAQKSLEDAKLLGTASLPSFLLVFQGRGPTPTTRHR